MHYKLFQMHDNTMAEAIDTFRQEGFEGEIIMISTEKNIPYKKNLDHNYTRKENNFRGATHWPCNIAQTSGIKRGEKKQTRAFKITEIWFSMTDRERRAA